MPGLRAVEETPMKKTRAATCNEKIYIVGDVLAPKASAANQITKQASVGPILDGIFTNRRKYDGKAADAPVFIMAEGVEQLGESVHQGLLATYKNRHPIVVMNGSEILIRQVLRILDMETSYQAPSGGRAPVIFAVEQDQDADFRWVLHSAPESSLNNLGARDGSDVAALFKEWLSKSGSRMTKKEVANKKEAVGALGAGVRKSPKNGEDFESYVRGFNSVETIPDGKNIYQLSYWVYSAHDFEADIDWYYVRQEGQLSGSGNYHTYEVHGVLGCGYTVRENYMYGYKMDNWFPAMTSPDVDVFRTSPSTETTSTKVTSEMNWGFSGELGFEGTKPKGNVGLSLDLKNTSEVIITDCQETNLSLSAGTNARWLYQFKEVTPVIYPIYVHFSEPSKLQVSLFQPINKWLWKVKGSARTNPMAKQFRSQLDWESVDSRGDKIGAWWTSTAKHTHTYGNYQFSVPVKQPPLLMADKNLSFTKKGQATTMAIAVGGNWTVSSDQNWCKPDKTGGAVTDKHLNITVDTNKTGADRTAILTFSTKHGTEVYTVKTEVFQSQY